jgi:hypothetical protein
MQEQEGHPRLYQGDAAGQIACLSRPEPHGPARRQSSQLARNEHTLIIVRTLHDP